MALRWPQSFATVFEDVLPQHLIKSVLDVADGLADSPNYWMQKEVFADFKAQLSPAEAVIRAVYHNCMQQMLPDFIAGAEYWVQVYKPGKGLAFHFDKDETLFEERQQMRHPILSSVLYLSGHKAELRLGPTVIVDQQFDNSEGCAFPQHPQRSALVWPQLNSLCVFDGRLGHGVLDSAAQGRRATMLINWWAYQPQASTATTGLLNWGVRKEALQAVHPPPSPPSKQPQTSERKKCETNYLHRVPQPPACSDCVNLEGAAATGVQDDASTQQTQLERNGDPVTERVNVPVIRVPPVDEPQAITIDDIMEGFNLTIQGETAVSALAIEHTGFQLFPIDDQQEEQLQSLRTAGALVSSELMDSDSSDSCE